jgi:molybdenum-dependent DNA-binding transcriptional regulator ModE
MDLKQLRTFRAVAELGSLSKAADRLRTAQPALSRHIKLLEHELRVELFVRNGRGMLLTSAGRMLLDRTTGLVRQIEQVRDDLQSASGKPSGRVILGLVPTVSAVFSGRFAPASSPIFRMSRCASSKAMAGIWSNGCIVARWIWRSSTAPRSICTCRCNRSGAKTSPRWGRRGRA